MSNLLTIYIYIYNDFVFYDINTKFIKEGDYNGDFGSHKNS